MIDVN